MTRPVAALCRLALLAVALVACVHRPSRATVGAPIDMAIVPGCPSAPDGSLSVCQWRRVVWAFHLYEAGAVTGFVTSGAAVHTPFVEADALAAGLEALGVPSAAIRRERRALHTDQNVAYALTMVDEARGGGTGPVLVASDGGQAVGMCSMVNAWKAHYTSVTGCVAAPLDEAWVHARLAEGVPDIRTEPDAGWLPLVERERLVALETGRTRPSSFWVYARGGFLNLFGLSRPPR